MLSAAPSPPPSSSSSAAYSSSPPSTPTEARSALPADARRPQPPPLLKLFALPSAWAKSTAASLTSDVAVRKRNRVRERARGVVREREVERAREERKKTHRVMCFRSRVLRLLLSPSVSELLSLSLSLTSPRRVSQSLEPLGLLFVQNSGWVSSGRKEKSEKFREESNWQSFKRNESLFSPSFTFLATSSGTLPAKPSAVATRPPVTDARGTTLPPLLPPPRELRFFRDVEDIFYCFKNRCVSSVLARVLATTTNSHEDEGAARELEGKCVLSRALPSLLEASSLAREEEEDKERRRRGKSFFVVAFVRRLVQF